MLYATINISCEEYEDFEAVIEYIKKVMDEVPSGTIERGYDDSREGDPIYDLHWPVNVARIEERARSAAELKAKERAAFIAWLKRGKKA